MRAEGNTEGMSSTSILGLRVRSVKTVVRVNALDLRRVASIDLAYTMMISRVNPMMISRVNPMMISRVDATERDTYAYRC